MPSGTHPGESEASSGASVPALEVSSTWGRLRSAGWFSIDHRALIGAWGLSLLMHLLALVLMLLAVLPVQTDTPRDLPVTRVEFLERPETLLDPATSATTSLAKTVDPRPATVPPRTITPLSELTVQHRPELSILAIGSGGGDLSQFGLTGGSTGSPEFFGLGSSAPGARSVVYVVDRSGSMVDTFHHVKAELRRSIGALRRSQKFHVIFFNEGDPQENPPRKLVSAIEAQKRTFFEFLDRVDATGSTHPEQSMRRALALEPDVVYFLTDGEFDRRLVDLLDQWNRGRRVRIFTIAYFNAEGAELLERIAREHGGEFRRITEDDLP